MMTLRRLSCALLIAATGSGVANAATIGVVAPRSGPYLSLGEQIVQGAQAAADTGRDTLVTIHESCEAGSGAVIAAELAAANVDAAIGFLCSETLAEALPALKDAEIPALTVSVRSGILMEDALKFGWPLFRLAPGNGAEAEKLSEIILDQWQGEPFALIEDGTIHGRELAEAIRNSLEENGLRPQFTDTFRPAQEQQVALVRRLGRTGITHLFVGGDRNDIATIARDAQAENIPLTILGSDTMAAPDQPVSLPDGVLAVTLPDHAAGAQAAETVSQLRDNGIEPDGYVLPSYAAIQIVREAVNMGGSVTTALETATFETVIGRIAFDEGHELSENPFQLQEWRESRFMAPVSATD